MFSARPAVIVQARTPGANPEAGRADLALLQARPDADRFRRAFDGAAENDGPRRASAGVTFFAMELVPRITRAQAMDALSSMASIAGYEAVLMAAMALPKIFPMMMTAAGTLTPAKVLILGAGVAGLQAIATARRLGAVVSAYDVRSAVKELIESLGAKFVVLPISEVGRRHRRLRQGHGRSLLQAPAPTSGRGHCKNRMSLITTAAVPGRKAPVLVTKEMAEVMTPGSVIVDIAAERGGNCELTQAGETVMHRGISIVGPVNLPSRAPFHASQMFATNVVNLLKLMVDQGWRSFDRSRTTKLSARRWSRTKARVVPKVPRVSMD